MTRTEIIAQLDAELGRLEHARDYLTVALKGSRSRLLSKVNLELPRKMRRQASSASLPVIIVPQASVPLPAAVLAPATEPQVHRVPPRRRVERRPAQADKPGKSAAALSGMVPAGPVAVSANEARKIQERAVAPPAAPSFSELRSEIGSERTLGSLIQAFERRAGVNGAEIP